MDAVTVKAEPDSDEELDISAAPPNVLPVFVKTEVDENREVSVQHRDAKQISHSPDLEDTITISEGEQPVEIKREPQSGVKFGFVDVSGGQTQPLDFSISADRDPLRCQSQRSASCLSEVVAAVTTDERLAVDSQVPQLKENTSTSLDRVDYSRDTIVTPGIGLEEVECVPDVETGYLSEPDVDEPFGTKKGTEGSHDNAEVVSPKPSTDMYILSTNDDKSRVPNNTLPFSANNEQCIGRKGKTTGNSKMNRKFHSRIRISTASGARRNYRKCSTPGEKVQCPIDKPYTCDMCAAKFSRIDTLNAHKRTHLGEDPYVCNVCNESFADRVSLISHRRTHSEQKPYVCEVCQLAFSRWGNLVSHKRTHSGERPFVCDVCNKTFSHSFHLVSHKRTHSGEKPYLCEVCNTGFSRRDTLVSHRRTHSGEKPFACNACTASFAQKQDLVRHTRIHSEEKPFVCDVCNADFTQRAYLTSHQKIHSEERPFICDTCSASFSRKVYLAIHKTIHSGEKPFVCDVCNMGFSRKSYLVSHRRTHSGEKPYCCHVCSSNFATRSNFVRHTRTHLKESP